MLRSNQSPVCGDHPKNTLEHSKSIILPSPFTCELLISIFIINSWGYLLQGAKKVNMGTWDKSSLLMISVLLVAPSATLAGPVPHLYQQQQQQQPGGVLPWQALGIQVGSGVSQASPQGGFIYCAGCGPLNPDQLVLPAQELPLPKSNLPAVNNRNPWEDDGVIPVQQMSLSDDGRYSFSYNTADSTRQEERNLDGSVQGSYSYTDDQGKHVQIDYTAGRSGYQAYGENIPPPVPTVQLPQPVQDTPEVQAARQRFFEAYAREVERIQKDAATATPQTPQPIASSTPSSAVETDSNTAASSVEQSTPSGGATAADQDTVDVSGENDDAVVVGGKSDNSAEHKTEPERSQIGNNGEQEDEHSDSIVISADDENKKDTARDSLPSPAYQITIPIGVGANAGFSVQGGGMAENENTLRVDNQAPAPVNQFQQAFSVPVNDAKPNNLQPYFYYVSVGGNPHYVTSVSQPGFRSPYPTSLKASLLGAIPIAAVHDAQVPNRGGGNNNPQEYSTAVRPVFLDLENSVNLEPQMVASPPKNNAPASTPSLAFNSNNNNQNLNQVLAQIVPFGLGSSGQFPSSNANAGSIGYIPVHFVNVQDLQQQSQQSHNAPVMQGSQNGNGLPVFFAPQQSASSYNQPLFVFSQKK